MSPLNRGPLLGPRVPPVGIRPPPLPPRFAGRLPPPGLPPRMPPPPGLPPRMPPPPINPVFGPMRQRLPPPPRPAGIARPAGPMPLFGPRGRGMAPIVPPMGLRGAGPRGPPTRPWHRRALPPQIMSHMRPRFPIGNGNVKGKSLNNVKKVNKLEELELKKPWMTDEIRSEIQKKNKLYAKAKKNKDAKEWEEFKDLRNKVTRMIRDAKNDYLAKHPEQGGHKTDDKSTIESEGVQKTENATEQSEQKEQSEETQPSSEQANLYPVDEEPYDQRDENHIGSDDESYYCEVCDRDFASEDSLSEHKKEHKLCGIDGCTFSAHPLLVERHINMQHSSGLYERMKNLSTPEDIEKWIIERKKKYPTKANIESRKAEELEKTQRGEIIKQNQNLVNPQKKKLPNSRERKRRGQKRHSKVLNETVHETNEIYRGLQTFPGTLTLVEINPSREVVTNENTKQTIQGNSNAHISDEEDLLVSSTSSPITNAGLSSLVADYGSDSEGSDAPEEVPFKKVKAADHEVDNDPEKQTNENKTLDKMNESIQESAKKQVIVPVSSVNSHCTKKDKRLTELEQHLKEKDHRNVRSKRPGRLRLLNKLLARSIQHERNLICQCIKYIVDNNFFD